jgi:hypothetical protein
MKKLAGLVSAAVFAIACAQTDAGITTAVKSKLAADDMVKAYQVDVDTQNKVVTLSGEVETSAQKEHAVMVARNTDGVADVIDQLRVNPTAATSGIDDLGDDIEAGAKRGVDAVKDGATRAGEEIEEGARKTRDAARDAVKDDDKD